MNLEEDNGLSAGCGNGKLRQWLIDQIDSRRYPGLVWENDERTIFRIPWKHAGKQDYNREEDAALFKVRLLHLVLSAHVWTQSQSSKPVTWIKGVLRVSSRPGQCSRGNTRKVWTSRILLRGKRDFAVRWIKAMTSMSWWTEANWTSQSPTRSTRSFQKEPKEVFELVLMFLAASLQWSTCMHACTLLLQLMNSLLLINCCQFSTHMRSKAVDSDETGSTKEAKACAQKGRSAFFRGLRLLLLQSANNTVWTPAALNKFSAVTQKLMSQQSGFRTRCCVHVCSTFQRNEDERYGGDTITCKYLPVIFLHTHLSAWPFRYIISVTTQLRRLVCCVLRLLRREEPGGITKH